MKFSAKLAIAGALFVSLAPGIVHAAKVTTPAAPTVVAISSSKASATTVNIKVTFTLPKSTGGSAIVMTVVSASGKTCTAKKIAKTCTIKGVKKSATLNVTAKSKNVKGYGKTSSAVRYKAGAAAWVKAIFLPTSSTIPSTTQTTTPTNSLTNPTTTPTTNPTTTPTTTPISTSPGKPEVGKTACTITGTSGDDNLIGTDRNDVICGGGGRDRISAKGGNDILYATLVHAASVRKKNVRIYTVRAYAEDTGTDEFDGGEGDDVMVSDDSTVGSQLDGGAGDDIVYGGIGNDDIDGGLGNDLIDAFDGNDQVEGGAGTDTMYGGNGDDALVGGAGSDTLDTGSTVQSGDLCDVDGSDVVTGFCGFDQRAPQIVDANFVKVNGADSSGKEITINTSAASASVTLEMSITDNLMGVKDRGVSCALYATNAITSSNFTEATRISGKKRKGVYQCVFNFPRYSPITVYRISLMTEDQANNIGSANLQTNGTYSNNGTDQIVADGFAAIKISQTGAGDDVEPTLVSTATRKLNGASVSSIDTSAAAKTVVMEIEATDNLSGVSEIACRATSGEAIGGPVMGTVSQLRGTATDGVWGCTLVFPQGSPQGKWFLSFSLADAVGNFINIDAGQNQGATATAGNFTTRTSQDVNGTLLGTNVGVSYIQQTGLGDNTFPTATSIRLDKTYINASSSAQVVSITMDTVDTGLGIRSIYASFTPGVAPGDVAQVSALEGCGGEPASGTRFNGTYVCSGTFPVGTRAAKWVLSIYLTDNAGHTTYYRVDNGMTYPISPILYKKYRTFNDVTGLATDVSVDSGFEVGVCNGPSATFCNGWENGPLALP